MTPLTKYDVLLYLSNGEVEVGKLIRQILQNAFFERTPERKIKAFLSELYKDGLILKNRKNKIYQVVALTSKAIDVIAFLLWARKDSINYNVLLREKNEQLFRKIFESGETSLMAKSTLSKPTTMKSFRELENAGFISVVKRKPLVVKARITDKTLLFANIFGYGFTAFQKSISSAKIEKDSPKLREYLIKLHVYSTTVTEGNTATEKDVEKVLSNRDTRLSPKEVIEIVNAKKAVDELCRMYKTEELSIETIKKLHRILMASLLENPGELSYTRKKIIGSATKLPDSKIEIDTELDAMLNFYARYKKSMSPAILAALVHFLFVSIHPFIDGNGRVARLIHSYIMMKAGMPLFAFDPDYRNKYFDLLDKGRTENVEEFVQFCIDKHKELIEKN